MQTVEKMDTLLLVDDVETNLDILVETLGNHYHLSVAMSGKDAIETIDRARPDLILLDIMMPEMSGYEVCETLKANPSTADIPIIFLTALSDQEDEKKGLSLGAVDYITKPFNPGIVHARVENQLSLANARTQLMTQNHALENSFHDLKELEELKDSLIHMIVHDLRTPLAVACGGLEFALDQLPPTDPAIVDSLKLAYQHNQDLQKMATALLDVSQLEAAKFPVEISSCNVSKITRTAVEESQKIHPEHPIKLNLPSLDLSLPCDPELFKRILSNLLDNAAKFSPPKSPITVKMATSEHWTCLAVKNLGPEIPKEYQSRIFNKFEQAQARKKGRKLSSGLGLTFCKLAIEAMGGSITMGSSNEHGTIFYIRLPHTQKASAQKLPSQINPLTLLIIDDERSITETLKRYFTRKTPWTVQTMNNPTNAVQLILSTQPDIVLLDINMQGLSGCEIVEAIQQRGAEHCKTKIIYYTGLLRPEETPDPDNHHSGKIPMVPKGLPLSSLHHILEKTLN